MPFVLVFIGLIALIAALRGRERQLGGLLLRDFSGPGNFIYWIIAIVIIGFIGYIPKMKGVSDAFLALVLLVMFISNKGVFARFNQAIAGTQSKPSVSPTQPVDSVVTDNSGGGSSSGSSSGGSSSSDSGGSDYSQYAQYAEIALLLL